MNDDELDNLIRQTHSAPEFTPSFRRDVWARLSVAEEGSRTASPHRWMEAFLQLMAQPSTAAAAVMTMLILGVGLGRLVAPEPDTDELRASYLVSINPTMAAHPDQRE